MLIQVFMCVCVGAMAATSFQMLITIETGKSQLICMKLEIVRCRGAQ